jgi:predicted nucleotidyltransferase
MGKMTLLQQLNHERAERDEALRAETRERLRSVLRRVAPANQVVVFGSLTKPHRFTGTSDIDIALEAEPVGTTLYQLTALLAEEMGRPVDVVLLFECRFRGRIAQEGEVWTLAA